MEKELSQKESLELITQMINKARNSFYDTGVGAIMWGAVITIISLVKLAELSFDFELPFDIFWLSFFAIVPQIFITVRERRMRQAHSYESAATSYVWLAFGICIFLLIHINSNVFRGVSELRAEHLRLSGQESGFHFSNYVLSYFLILYGLPTFITGTICRFRPMIWGGILCWVCCVVSVYTSIRVDLLLMAVSSFFAWFVPGLILQQQYSKAKKKLIPADV